MIRYVDLRLSNYFCSRIRVLCVDVFRESLEWGLVLSRRSGSWEFLLGLCAHHGWLYLCYDMALSLTLSLSLLVTPPLIRIETSKNRKENRRFLNSCFMEPLCSLRFLKIWFSNSIEKMFKNRIENLRFSTSPCMKPSGSLRFLKLLETNGSLISLCVFFQRTGTSDSPFSSKNRERWVSDSDISKEPEPEVLSQKHSKETTQHRLPLNWLTW
jgi:hypothetical protein